MEFAFTETYWKENIREVNMGVSAAVFESAGKRTEHYVPGVYSRSNNVTSPSSVSSGNLCILGSSIGGKPLSLLEFGDIAEAKNALVSGELLEGVGLAFSGSNEYIPQKVFAMRVNGGAQASLDIVSGGSNVMKLTAWDYGTHTNQLKIKIEAGTAEDSKKVTVSYKDNSVVVDNIVKKSLKVSSSKTEATVTVDKTSMTLAYMEEEESKSVVLLFSDFPKLSELAERINTETGFIATLTDSDETALSSDLDFVQSKSLATETILYSNRKAFADAVMGIEYIGSIELGEVRSVPENMAYTYFTGGSSDSAIVSDWVSALEKLEVEDIQIISTTSTDSNVHALIASHCTQMGTTVNRKERTCILGGALGMSDEDAITTAVGFNNKLVSFVIDNPVINNPFTGEKETVSGAKLAVMLAGMESAMSVNMPLTNKSLNVLGFSKKRTISNMENLIKGGVIVCNPSPDEPTNYVCIRGITTYQSADLINNERSMVREDLFMNRDLRKKFSSGIGGINGNGIISKVLATLNDTAKEWADLEYIIPNGNKNVWNTKVKVDGDKIYLTYSRYLTAPTNFIFITATNHVYTSTVEL